MSEHDETLQNALEENARQRSEREESLREVASTEYAGHLRSAERAYWLYGLACVVLGVAAVNFFVRSFDIKTLIGCAVVLLMIYQTTVLMRLWFTSARMKMDVLKDVKLLRLDMARLATAVGVEKPSEPPAKYEPMRGIPEQERRAWLTACAVVAVLTACITSHAWFGGGDVSTDTLVNLAADGSAEKQRERVRDYAGYYIPSGFSLYAPKDWNVRLLDPTGQEMPIQVVATDTQHRHDVTFTDRVVADGKMRYTEIFEIPKATEPKDGVWTYEDGMHIVGFDEKYSITILLPPGARLLSAGPTADVKLDEDGRTHVRFQGTTINNKKYKFTVRYELPSTSEQEE